MIPQNQKIFKLEEFLVHKYCPDGGMVYTGDLKFPAVRLVGSSPTLGTIRELIVRSDTNSVTAQHPLHQAPGMVLGSSPAEPFRPRLATTHSILVWRGFSLFYFVWWWRVRAGFSKGETDGILSSHSSVDSVLPNYFSGDLDLAKPRLNCSRPQKVVWGMNAGG